MNWIQFNESSNPTYGGFVDLDLVEAAYFDGNGYLVLQAGKGGDAAAAGVVAIPKVRAVLDGLVANPASSWVLASAGVGLDPPQRPFYINLSYLARVTSYAPNVQANYPYELATLGGWVGLLVVGSSAVAKIPCKNRIGLVDGLRSRRDLVQKRKLPENQSVDVRRKEHLYNAVA